MSGSASAGRKATARCLAAAVASVLAIMLAPAVASAKPPTAGGSPGGATVPWGFNEDWGWSNGAFGGSQMANLHMQKAGAIMPDSLSANRFHVEWAYVEGVRGTYNWSMSDAQYAAMQKYTKKPIMLLYRAPVWARDPARTCAQGSEEQCIYPPLPQYDGDWKAFVKAAVTRYPNVRAIEVWNEPNIATFWSPAADPDPLLGHPQRRPRRSPRRGQQGSGPDRRPLSRRTRPAATSRPRTSSMGSTRPPEPAPSRASAHIPIPTRPTTWPGCRRGSMH